MLNFTYVLTKQYQSERTIYIAIQIKKYQIIQKIPKYIEQIKMVVLCLKLKIINLKQKVVHHKYGIITIGCDNVFEQQINILENSKFADDYVILKGSVPILFSAPHTMYQLRDDGTTKLKEPYTKALSSIPERLRRSCRQAALWEMSNFVR